MVWKVTGYTLAVVAVLVLCLLMVKGGETLEYHVFYKSMVEQTVTEMVIEAALK